MLFVNSFLSLLYYLFMSFSLHIFKGVYMDLEEWEDALAFFDDALIVLAETPGGDSPEMVRTLRVQNKSEYVPT